MPEVRLLAGTLIVTGAAANSWVESANSYGTLAVTVIGALVGIATLYYTVLRVISLRRDIKKAKNEG